ncbi:class I SAM-dependent methyltransferase [Micromonospora carbonacea]|uniref:class I SAM-dependent methyltransferase n=1 Tax=Micromonospora carbonacea TaxID=47853 RepID=UPI00371557DD
MTHAFDKGYWEQIWQGDRAPAMAAAGANPHLVREVDDLTPGTALEAGCGAGAEAIWLAARGWRVTAADVAAGALARAADRAAAAGVAGRVRWVEADLSTWQPPVRYDLVTTHYAHPAMPQLDFYERVASWVAPGGTLFIVGHLQHHDRHATAGHGHDHGPGGHDRGPDGGPGHGHDGGPGAGETGPPAAASVTAADITARLDPAGWEIVTAQESRRTVTGPGGHPVTLHDVVVRARRRR